MLAKLKKNNKQINESVVNREDFVELLKEIDGKGLSEEILAMLQPLVQVNPNHAHIFQAKIARFLFDEIHAKRDALEKDKVIPEPKFRGGEIAEKVLSFKQLESDDSEDEDY